MLVDRECCFFFTEEFLLFNQLAFWMPSFSYSMVAQQLHSHIVYTRDQLICAKVRWHGDQRNGHICRNRTHRGCRRRMKWCWMRAWSKKQWLIEKSMCPSYHYWQHEITNKMDMSLLHRDMDTGKYSGSHSHHQTLPESLGEQEKEHFWSPDI